jgi:Fic family protein
MSTKHYPINPDRLIPWNELPLLPLDKELYYTVDVIEHLANAKSALAKLQGRSAAIPNQGLLINSISLQEAKASSAIENIFTTDDELYKAYSEEGTGEHQQGAPKEILRYREALWAGHKYMHNKSDFDSEYFISIYREIQETTDGIRPPTAGIIIRQGGSGPNAGKVIYTPPRGKGIVEDKLNNLLEFINNDRKYVVDPILKMAIAHYQFETIHPFRDGNGRTGRIFNIHYLTNKGLLDLPILFLSRYIMDNKEDYYSCLSGVSQRGSWQNWIRYMLKAIEVTSNITYIKINDIIAAKESILNAIETDTDIRKPAQLTEMIFTQPFTKVKHLTDKKMYAENTARQYLQKLCDMGILEKKTIQGKHYYLNLELYRILSE